MPAPVTPLDLGFDLFKANSYLVAASAGFILVDTGMRRQRARLLSGLQAAGCWPGDLKLIFLTHGDMDHIGNVAHIAHDFWAPIAMHPGDAPMAAGENMFWGRKPPNPVMRALLGRFTRLREEDRFVPDLLLDEGFDLADYGLSGARVLLLQAHSAGSVALLLEDGSLLCGDVLENRRRPGLGLLMDDVPQARASVRRLAAMKVGTVFPGHGQPFEFARLPEAQAL